MPVLTPGVIGTIEDIPALARSHNVDRVVVSLADARGKLPMDKLLEMKLAGVTFDHLASVYEDTPANRGREPASELADFFVRLSKNALLTAGKRAPRHRGRGGRAHRWPRR